MDKLLYLSHSEIHRSYCCIFKSKQTGLKHINIKLSGNENRYHHSNIC